MDYFGIIAVILWITTIIGFVIYNLYRKNKKMEDVLLDQQRYIAFIAELNYELEAISNKIDTTMWVQSDPELIQLFETVKNISATIKSLTKANGNQ